MSCNDTNPCNPPCQDPCCNETDPCFDNCGCLNPTTFECVAKPGTCEATGITNDMTGREAMTQICTTISQIQEDSGKILIDGNDTCPEFIWDKLEAGLNISFTQTGTGCDKKIVINATEGGVPVDVNAKVSASDTTTGYLNSKIDTGVYTTKTIVNPAGNEILKIDVDPEQLVSADAGNQLTIGVDGGLKTIYTAPDGSETVIIQGNGVTVTGSGTSGDPYVVSTNSSIQAVRSCFDNTWRNITLVATGNANVIHTAGNPQYRYRFDGTIEFRGSSTYSVAFSDYQSGNRKFTITMGNIPINCLNATEQAGVSDLKNNNYIDPPQAAADQIVQQYGYTIRKSAQNILLEFQSAFSSATTKIIVVNFEGAVSHPNI